VEVRPRLRRVTGRTTGQWTRKPQLGLVGIADELALLSVNAEVMSSRVDDIARARPSSVIIPATCADEVIGYWPTSVMLEEGGYEGCTSRPFFPTVDWGRDDPDVLWSDMLARALEHPRPDTSPTRTPSSR
ncbi:MAG: hypothetical protein ABWZ91_14500, partial [Nocardioides sp.]